MLQCANPYSAPTLVTPGRGSSLRDERQASRVDLSIDFEYGPQNACCEARLPVVLSPRARGPAVKMEIEYKAASRSKRSREGVDRNQAFLWPAGGPIILMSVLEQRAKRRSEALFGAGVLVPKCALRPGQ
jgi:hypothetical protein